METQKRKYDLDFKIKAVELAKQRGSNKAIADELNIPYDNIKRWRKEYGEGKLNNNYKPPVKTPVKLELIKLKKELYNVTQERDILKKAVSIFSKSDR
jgi:transposase